MSVTSLVAEIKRLKAIVAKREKMMQENGRTIERLKAEFEKKYNTLHTDSRLRELALQEQMGRLEECINYYLKVRK